MKCLVEVSGGSHLVLAIDLPELINQSIIIVSL